VRKRINVRVFATIQAPFWSLCTATEWPLRLQRYTLFGRSHRIVTDVLQATDLLTGTLFDDAVATTGLSIVDWKKKE